MTDADKRIAKLRRWSTGKSADMDTSLTWDDVKLLLGRIDALTMERDSLREALACDDDGSLFPDMGSDL